MDQDSRHVAVRATRIVRGLGFMLALGLGACAPIGPSPPPAPTYLPVDKTDPRATLVVGSPDLLGRVLITEPQLRVQGALTEAGVTVQNLSAAAYVLEYLFEWEDDSGFNVDDTKVWRRFTLTPYQIMKFTSVGPSPESTRIRFTVRYPESRF